MTLLITGQIQHVSVVSWQWETCWYVVLMNNNLIAWRWGPFESVGMMEVLRVPNIRSATSTAESVLPDCSITHDDWVYIWIGYIVHGPHACKHLQDCSHARKIIACFETVGSSAVFAPLWPGQPSAGYNVLHFLVTSKSIFQINLWWYFKTAVHEFSLKRAD